MENLISDFSWNYVFYVAFVLVVGWGWVIWMKNRADYNRSLEMIFLQVKVPKKDSAQEREEERDSHASNDFKEVVGVMSHLFNALYSVYNDEIKSVVTGQDYLSFEYAVVNGKLTFYMVVPRSLANMVEKQVTAFYPDSFITEERDYNIFRAGYKTATCYLQTVRSEEYPIVTYEQMKSDSLNAIVNSVSKIKNDEGVAVQVLIRPVKDGWQERGRKKAEAIMENKKESASLLNPLVWLGGVLDIARGEQKRDEKNAVRVSPLAEEQAKAIGVKAGNVGFETVIRLVTSAQTKAQALGHLNTLRGAFQQFSSPNLNMFKQTRHHSERKFLKDFIYRTFRQNWWWKWFGKRMIFSPDELSGLWHLPNAKYNKSPNIDWQKYKIAPAPDGLPSEGVLLGYNKYRGEEKPIYLSDEDRFRHFYVIGQTGTGKSSILQTMIHQDFKNGKGLAVIDPHGQLIEDLLPHIPKERVDDVIIFNPADTERPMGLNLLEAQTEEERDLIALDAMNIMIKLFDEETFGPRIQDYFRNGCLTLMEDPDGGALTDIVRLFTDDVFQQYKVSKVKNPVVRSFWENQMAKTGAREKAEMIPYFAAKFGAFVTNTLMRNIIGQTKSAFDFSEVMQGNKILLINLSKGLIGDLNSKLLGMIIVNKLQVAALRRQRMVAGERQDFFLYIDEFQNYVTDSIESILSEARKYRLGLCLAHQYLDQLVDDRGNDRIKKAVFGNVGTMMCYKIGAGDGEFMAKEMEPVFSDQDLINLDAFQTAIKLSVNNQPTRPFSMSVQKPWEEGWQKKYPRNEAAAEIYKEISRLKYGRDKKFVSKEIERRIGVLRDED